MATALKTATLDAGASFTGGGENISGGMSIKSKLSSCGSPSVVVTCVGVFFSF